MADIAPAIALQDVTKRHGANPAPVLDRVTLDVPSGRFLAVAGQSGAGKTTLLRLINRLIEPTSGAVLVAGEDVRGIDPVQLRRRIGYVFQGVGLFPHMTVGDNIAITPRLLGWDDAAIAARIDELLDLVQLDRARHRERFPHELSGGERQRVGFARALAAKPRIMLMDEPFGALDPLTRETLTGDYRALHDKLGLTTVMITHDMTEALLLADRIAVLHGGRLIAQDTPHGFMRDGHDGDIAALMQTPRRHAARLQALADGHRPR